MVLTLMVCMMMMKMMSPMKVAFSVTVMSIMVGLTTYSFCVNIFPTVAIVISFSSGMMILFCYCAMLSNHESKNLTSKSSIVVTLVMIPMITLIMEKMSKPYNETISLMMSSYPMMILGMSMVMVTMICINKSMFSPSKSLVESY